MHLRLPIVALLALVFGGCLPTPDRPGSDRFDAGTPINLDAPAMDAPAMDAPPVDVPPVDRPVVMDVGRDVVATDGGQAPLDGPDLSRRYPAGPYGIVAPSVMLPFQLADCGGGVFRFDGADWVPAWGTVVEFTVPYCDGCEENARRLHADVARIYQRRGIRFITVLIDGSSPGDPPTARFCRDWAGTLNIIGPGEPPHPMAIDLGGMVRAHTAGLALPQWVLTDENGRIVWRGTGSATAVTTLTGHIRNLLGLGP